MSKLKRCLAVFLCVLALFGVSAKEVSYASTAGITGTIKAKVASATFNYGKTGYRLTVEMYTIEEHSTTGHVYKKTTTGTAAGNFTSASAYKSAEEGYNFTKMSAVGTVNGVETAWLEGITP